MRSARWILALTLFALLHPACGGGAGGGAGGGLPHVPGWTWRMGSNLVNAPGNYGVKGVAAASNMPGARYEGATWKDASGILWLFGGEGWDGAGVHGQLGDLWKFDGTTWTWMAGSSSADPLGVYGTQGVAAAANIPGGRSRPSTWVDGAGNFWLFGGTGLDETLTGFLNDLWRFDGSNWTWVSGGKVKNAPGVYGTLGVAAAANHPGGRINFVPWQAAGGLVYFFGGQGYDKNGTNNPLNDFWRFDGTNWAWMAGSDVVNQAGVYGTLGVPDPANIPGARTGHVAWTNGTTFWLFGGTGIDSTGIGAGPLCDVWRYNGSWAWMGGTNVFGSPGVYGTLGVPAAANHPGGRLTPQLWQDAPGHVWLFGGLGVDGAGTSNGLSDLWSFDGTTWTWAGGLATANASGVYGTMGVFAAANLPGARRGGMTSVDAAGGLWLFGGLGNDSTGANSRLNDLWHYAP